MTGSAYLKHFLHHARDLPIRYETDLIQRRIAIQVNWIDTLLLQRFLTDHLLEDINQQLTKVNKLPLLESLTGFEIELLVGQDSRFELKLMERDFEPREATLIIKPKE